jgi:biopolymer transport protein ExbB
MDPRPSATAEDGTIELVPIPPEVWPTPATDAPAGLRETVAAWLPDALAPARIAFLVEAGGPVVVVLAAMSLVAATVVIAKLLQFRAHQLAAEAPVLAAASW